MPCETTPIRLGGSAKDDAPLKLCAGPCGKPVLQGGGVQMTPTKWWCQTCWKTRKIGEATKARNVANRRAKA
jgi:hypothetical protein